MSEIEKMYSNVGVEKERHCTKTGNCYYPECTKCDYYNYTCYPPFTAEKQLELIKWLGKYDYFEVYYRPVQKDWIFGNKTEDSSHYDFTLGLASWIVHIWQDLTEEERKQIKGILE